MFKFIARGIAVVSFRLIPRFVIFLFVLGCIPCLEGYRKEIFAQILRNAKSGVPETRQGLEYPAQLHMRTTKE